MSQYQRLSKFNQPAEQPLQELHLGSSPRESYPRAYLDGKSLSNAMSWDRLSSPFSSSTFKARDEVTTQSFIYSDSLPQNDQEPSEKARRGIRRIRNPFAPIRHFTQNVEKLEADAFRSSPGEEPKVAIRYGFIKNLPLLVPHFIAILVSLAVVQLSFRNHYWMDLAPPQMDISPGITQSGALNALQFAAKLHELIIIASLTTLLMHAVRTHLLGKAGLPFGLLASGFQVSSGDFLRRKGFWASWLAGRKSDDLFTRLRYLPYLLLFLASAIIATLSGPSSAIAIVPTLDWFNLDHPFATNPPSYYIYNTTSPLWPSEASNSSLPWSEIDCRLPPVDEGYINWCPVGGYAEIYQWSQSLIFVDSFQGVNVSFEDTNGKTRRVASVRSCPPTDVVDGKASGFTLNSFLAGALTSYWDWVSSNLDGLALKSAQPRISLDLSVDLFAPRVNVLCRGYEYIAQTVHNQSGMVFPSINNDPSDPSHAVPASAWNISRPLNATDFKFIPLPHSPDGPSIGAVLFVPFTEEVNGVWQQASETITCSIYAEWAPITAWYEPTTSDQVQFSLLDSNPNSCLDLPLSTPPTATAKSLTIAPIYAEAINMLINFTGKGNIPAILAMLQNYVVPSSKVAGGVLLETREATRTPNNITSNQAARRQRSSFVATLLAMQVTDGLARLAGNGEWPFSTPAFLKNTTSSSNSTNHNANSTTTHGITAIFPQDSTTAGNTVALGPVSPTAQGWFALPITLQRYGYGYHWRDNPTVQFGISVLLIHVAMALCHVAYVTWKTGVKGEGLPRAWDSVGEIVAMAYDSGVAAGAGASTAVGGGHGGGSGGDGGGGGGNGRGGRGENDLSYQGRLPDDDDGDGTLDGRTGRRRDGSAMANTGAGIDEWATWRRVVGVRERGGGRRLGLVFGEGEMGRLGRARTGVAYG